MAQVFFPGTKRANTERVQQEHVVELCCTAYSSSIQAAWFERWQEYPEPVPSKPGGIR